MTLLLASIRITGFEVNLILYRARERECITKRTPVYGRQKGLLFMKTLRFLSLSFAVLLIGGVSGMTSAFAHENACATDLQKLCPDAKTWKDKGACLKQNEASLSPACTTARQEFKQKWEARKAEFKQACGSDVQQFCSSSTKGGIFKCLKQNADKLSQSCQVELKKAHKHRHHSNSSSTQASQ